MALLDDFLAAQGGLERWRRVATIRARVRAGGLLIATRVPALFRDCPLTIRVTEPWTRFEPIGSDERLTFDGRRVRREGPGGVVLDEREDPRAAFFGLAGLRRNLRWDVLDMTYFAGYAIWNYLALPILLAGDSVEVSEGPRQVTAGRYWRRLDARFAPEVPTHSRRQTFYLCEDGLLRRHDYAPEVVTRFVRTAHFCADHRAVGGLVFATRRWVRPILPGGAVAPFPTLITLEIDDIAVEERS